MAGKPQSLTSTQQSQLDEIRKANLNLRRIKQEGMDELRRAFAEKIATAEAMQALAVAEGLRLDIPKSRINKEGLGTSDPLAFKKVIEHMPGATEVVQHMAPAEKFEHYRWENRDKKLISVWDEGLGNVGTFQLDGRDVAQYINGDRKTLEPFVRGDHYAELVEMVTGRDVV